MTPPRLFSLTVVGVFAGVALLPIGFMLLASATLPAASQTVGSGIFGLRLLGLARNSFALSVGAAACCLIVGCACAFFVARTNLRGRRVFSGIFIVPVLIPPYIHAIVWTRLEPFLMRHLAFDVHTLAGGIFILTLAYFPFVYITAMAGFRSVPRQQEEAALMVSGPLNALRRITFPMSLPHFIAGTTFVFIFAIINVAVPDILRIRVYPLEIFIQYSAFYDARAAMLLSMPLVGLTLALVVFQHRWMKNRSYVQFGPGWRPADWFHLKKSGQAGGLLFCGTVAGLSVFLPLAVLLVEAGGPSIYGRVLSTSSGQIGYSVLLASAAALAAAALGWSIAYVAQRSMGKIALAVSLITIVPLAVPATTMGIGLIGVWNRAAVDLVYESSAILVVAYMASFVPYAGLIAASGISAVSPRMEEAAVMTGAGWGKVMRRVLLPLTRRHVAAACFVVFILSLGELGMTLLVIPPGRETIPVKIYNLMHYGAGELVAAACVLLVGIVLLLGGAFYWFQRRLDFVRNAQ